MPELPEVETVVRGLQPWLEGAEIIYIRQSGLPMHGRILPPDLSKSLLNTKIEGLARRGKYMLFSIRQKGVMLLHLGMSGSCRIDATPRQKDLPKHVHLEFTLDTGNLFSFYDPRRFGAIGFYQLHQVIPAIDRLGVEPLSNHFNAEDLYAMLQKRSGQIKPVLLDQSLIAGLGNIYVCEALWQASINPKMPANQLTEHACQYLVVAIKDVLTRAIQSGGSSLKDHLQVDGTLGYFQHNFNAYNRKGEACCFPQCTGSIQRIVQAGRVTFYCDQHQ